RTRLRASSARISQGSPRPRGAGTRSLRTGRRARSSEPHLDDAFALEIFELAGAEPKQLAINICVVLAQQGRGCHFDRRILEADGTSRHREVAAHGMFDGDDHAALLEMRIIEQLDAVEHGATRDAGLAED